MQALIIVDVQNDFVAGGSLAVPQGEAIIPLVNQLSKKFALVAATQDWHPPDHKSFASNHRGKSPFERITLAGLDQTLWPDHCVQGTRGAELHRELDTTRVEAIFRKGMVPEIDSYSAFFDNGQRKSTGLSGYLKERGVTTVYVCGLAGDYCVYFTARDALKEGFKTVLIQDATRPIDDDGFARARSELQRAGGKISNSAEIV